MGRPYSIKSSNSIITNPSLLSYHIRPW